MLQVVGAAIIEGGRCLVAQRGAGQSAALKWEFPGGKVEPGEAAVDALAREVREELGVEIRVGGVIGSAEVAELRLTVYRAHLVSGTPTPLEHHALLWVTADRLAELDWADADVPLVSEVQGLLEDAESLR